MVANTTSVSHDAVLDAAGVTTATLSLLGSLFVIGRAHRSTAFVTDALAPHSLLSADFLTVCVCGVLQDATLCCPS